MQVHYSYLVSKFHSVKSKLPEGLTQYYNHSDWPTWICSNDLSEGYNWFVYALERSHS
jgi:hypothetical protein